MTSRSAAETEALGARSPSGLEPGDVVVVSGEVGAGKTTLIRGACRALGIEEPVTSPTFTIGQRYGGGRLPVSHLDLYRLEGLEERGPGPARRLPRRRRRRLRRVAGGRGPGGSAEPALEVRLAHAGRRQPAIEIELAHLPHRRVANRRVRRWTASPACSIGARNSISKEGSAANEGTEDADGGAAR